MGYFQRRELVVARYGESVEWLSHVSRRVRTTVYDKLYDGANPLPNVGREAHTYAWHVFHRYESLAEITFFSQGNPFDHVADIVWETERPTWEFRALGRTMRTGPFGDAGHTNLPNAETYRSLTGLDFPELVLFSPGACFAARDSVLRRYPREWWRELVELLADPANRSWGPWCMERLWQALLDPSVSPGPRTTAGTSRSSTGV